MTAPQRRGSGRDAEAQAMFVELRAQGDPRMRDRLIERYLPLARSVAQRYRHTPESFEDVLQVASLALVKAVDGFDHERGLAFSSYAVPTMIGEIKRHFRDTAWALHVPRALKDKVLLVERCERDCAAALRRPPTVEELAAASGLTQEGVLDALEARSAHDAESIETGGGSRGEETAGPSATIAVEDERFEQLEVRASLSSALGHLSDRDRLIIRLRFVDGLTQTRIAERVGLSQMQVSRRLRDSLRRLRSLVED